MSQDRDSISIWNVYLPYGMDRSKYIDECYLTGTVTLINQNAEVIRYVKIGRLAIQLVDFPEDQKKIGSEVACVTVPYSGELRVVEVYGNGVQYDYSKENQLRFYKRNGIGTSGILLDGAGNIIMSVDGDKDNGNISISVTNKDRAGKLTINVNGELIIENDGKTLIKSSKEIKLDCEKIFLNQSDEPILLGNKVVQFLSDWLDQLGKESAGPYPLLGNSVYIQFKEKLEDLKSQLSFVK